MKEKEKLFKKYKTLKQYKNKTDDELYELIAKKLSKKTYEIDLTGLFSDTLQIKQGKKLAEYYLSKFAAEEETEIEELKQLIWDEVTLNRIRQTINKKCDENPKYIPDDDLKVVDELSKRIISRKRVLGFFEKKEEDKKESDGYKLFEQLKKKAEVWYQQHQGSYQLYCPVRKSMCLLKIRTDKYECGNHPYFEDRVLTNIHLMKLFCEEKITKEDVAKILGTSPDYIDWLVEKWKSHPKYIEFLSVYRDKKRKEGDNEETN